MEQMVDYIQKSTGLNARIARDLAIQKQYLTLMEVQHQRIRMEWIHHPEMLKRTKGIMPEPSMMKLRQRQVFSDLGLGEQEYGRLIDAERILRQDLVYMGSIHPLWNHFSRLKGFGPYLCTAFIAASGDISKPSTVTIFWKTMGLDVLPDGTVPRKIRGNKTVARKVPCYPFVSTAGELIRQQLLRSGGKLYEHYVKVRAHYDAKYPDRPKMWNFKAALRGTQKVLYACLWEVWREEYGLPTPLPYAYAMLQHDISRKFVMADFYDKATVNSEGGVGWKDKETREQDQEWLSGQEFQLANKT